MKNNKSEFEKFITAYNSGKFDIICSLENNQFCKCTSCKELKQNFNKPVFSFVGVVKNSKAQIGINLN